MTPTAPLLLPMDVVGTGSVNHRRRINLRAAYEAAWIAHCATTSVREASSYRAGFIAACRALTPALEAA